MISLKIPKSFIIGILLGLLYQSLSMALMGVLLIEIILFLLLGGSYLFYPKLVIEEIGFVGSVLRDNINLTAQRWAPSFLFTRLFFRIFGLGILTFAPAGWSLGIALICPTVCYIDED
jgi:hypothetical protein